MLIKHMQLRDAKNSEVLPTKLKDMWLLGSHDGVIYIASSVQNERGYFDDIFLYGYSLSDNRVTCTNRIKGGGWPESWAEKDGVLYVGTRWGKIFAINLGTGRKRQKELKFNNAIDTIAANNHVFFGVNGDGVYRTDSDLCSRLHYAKSEEWKAVIDGKSCERKSLPIISAMTFHNGNLYVFHFSNGRDPFLGEDPCGGLVEVLDENFHQVSGRKLSPYAVCHVLSSEDGVYFATENRSNGWIPHGEGSLYKLDEETLEDEEIVDAGAAVTSLARRDGEFILGLHNGAVLGVKGGRYKKIIYRDGGGIPIKGIDVDGSKIRIVKTGSIIEVA